jgi:hypothetical protein
MTSRDVPSDKANTEPSRSGTTNAVVLALVSALREIERQRWSRTITAMSGALS